MRLPDADAQSPPPNGCNHHMNHAADAPVTQSETVFRVRGLTKVYHMGRE